MNLQSINDKRVVPTAHDKKENQFFPNRESLRDIEDGSLVFAESSEIPFFDEKCTEVLPACRIQAQQDNICRVAATLIRREND